MCHIVTLCFVREKLKDLKDRLNKRLLKTWESFPWNGRFDEDRRDWINIKSFEITEVALPVVHFKVVCSTGTYIRSLANDFGAALGVGGYMSSLCRTKIGNFNVEDAYTFESFENYVQDLRNDIEV